MDGRSIDPPPPEEDDDPPDEELSPDDDPPDEELSPDEEPPDEEPSSVDSEVEVLPEGDEDDAGSDEQATKKHAERNAQRQIRRERKVFFI